MKVQVPYSQTPQLLKAYLPKQQKQRFHLHGRKIQNWDSLKSVFLDQHYEGFRLLRKALVGGFLGFIFGIQMRTIGLRGPRKFEMDRFWFFNKYGPTYSPVAGYTAYGAWAGSMWWLIKDAICLPHGQDTYLRRLIAYGLMGGVLYGTLYNPVNFGYGFIAGAIVGSMKFEMDSPKLPRGFQLKIKSVDEQRRQNLLREDQQYQLSLRNSIYTRHNLYPL